VDEWKQLQLPIARDRFPLSLANVHVIIIRALERGFVHVTEHFKQRCIDRKFTTIDAERIAKTGKIRSEPEYSQKFSNWCFCISGRSEGRVLEMRIALDCKQDLDFPLVVFITGVVRRT